LYAVDRKKSWQHLRSIDLNLSSLVNDGFFKYATVEGQKLGRQDLGTEVFIVILCKKTRNQLAFNFHTQGFVEDPKRPKCRCR